MSHHLQSEDSWIGAHPPSSIGGPFQSRLLTIVRTGVRKEHQRTTQRTNQMNGELEKYPLGESICLVRIEGGQNHFGWAHR